MTNKESSRLPMNPALGYERFEKLLRHAEPALRASAPVALGYPAQEMADRLMQRVAELALHPSMRAAAARHEAGLDPFLPDNASEELGGLRFDAGRIVITPAAWLRAAGEFGAQWLRGLWVMMGAFLEPRKAIVPIPAALLFGVGAEDLEADGSDARFVEFCRNGPLPLLAGAGHLIVERGAPAASTEPDLITYERYPLFEAARLRRPAIADLARFLADHLRAAGAFLRVAMTRPLAALLGRDLAFHAIARDLTRRRLVHAIFITNSHYHVQPLWMRVHPRRGFTTHLAWYSQNSIPFRYARDGVQAYLPNHRFIAVDDIWVWTPGYARYLRERGARGRIHVVGPILWYLPAGAPSSAPGLQIAVFDVTPQVPSFTIRVGLSYNYYRAAQVTQFIADVVRVRDEMQSELREPITILLKHKRTPSVHHDPDYVALIVKLEREGLIRLVPPHANVYGMVEASALVVVMPYSSPAYVAAAMGVPSVYYDPEGELTPSYEPGEGVEFAAGRDALRGAMARALTKRLTSLRRSASAESGARA